MSATEAFAKPKIVWPELPIELWIRILRCAASLPEDFDLELVRGAFQVQYSSKLYREVLVRVPTPSSDFAEIYDRRIGHRQKDCTRVQTLERSSHSAPI